MRGLAVLTRGLGMLRTANTFRLRLLPQGLSSVAKGASGKQVKALRVLADQFPTTHSMAENHEVLCRRISISHGSLSTCSVCVVHKVHKVTVAFFRLIAVLVVLSSDAPALTQADSSCCSSWCNRQRPKHAMAEPSERREAPASEADLDNTVRTLTEQRLGDGVTDAVGTSPHL